MTDVQRLSSLYDATKSKLLENETYSQVLLHCNIGVLVAGVPVTAASADCSCPGRPCYLFWVLLSALSVVSSLCSKGTRPVLSLMVCLFLLFFCNQLGNMERKWQHHEQNNFVMKECILFMFIFPGMVGGESVNDHPGTYVRFTYSFVSSYSMISKLQSPTNLC